MEDLGHGTHLSKLKTQTFLIQFPKENFSRKENYPN